MMLTEVLVSRTPSESLYFRLAPDDASLDGRVQRGDESVDVPFWSYASRMPVAPILDTKFHKDLWNGKTDDAEWVVRFWTRDADFTDEQLESLVGWEPSNEPAKDRAEPKKATGDGPGAATKTGRTLSARTTSRLREALKLVEAALVENDIVEKSDLDDLVSTLDDLLD